MGDLEQHEVCKRYSVRRWYGWFVALDKSGHRKSFHLERGFMYRLHSTLGANTSLVLIDSYEDPIVRLDNHDDEESDMSVEFTAYIDECFVIWNGDISDLGLEIIGVTI